MTNKGGFFRGLRDTMQFRVIIIAVCVHLGIWFVAAVASSVTAINVILDAQDAELKNQANFVDFAARQFIAFSEDARLPLTGELGGHTVQLTQKMVWEGNPMMYWNNQGELIFQTENAPQFASPPVNQGITEHFTDETFTLDGQTVDWRVFYRRVGDIFWVAVGIDTRESRQAIIGIGLRALYPMVLIIPLTVIGIYLGTSRGLRPMADLAAAVEMRSPSSLDPIPTNGIHREMRPMLDSLNGLLGRLSEALENEHRFTSNAAHELQTPLTAIKAELQMRQRSVRDEDTAKMLDAIGDRVDRAVYTVRQLLMLARLEALDSALPMQSVDLHAVAEQALADHGHLLVERALKLEFAEDENWPLLGHAETLEILVGNLLSNALRYTPDGGKVLIDSQAIKDDSGSAYRLLRVCNTSQPMTLEEREAMVERFYRRPGTDQPGAGLGLSIVQRIVDVHGATLSIEPWGTGNGRKDDGALVHDHGIAVDIRFPA